MVAKACGSAEGFREKVVEFPHPCRAGRGLLMYHIEYKIGRLAEDGKRTRADLSPGFVKILLTSGGLGDNGPFALDSWPWPQGSDLMGLGW